VLLALQQRLRRGFPDFLERCVPNLSWETDWKRYEKPIKLVVETIQDCQVLLENMAGFYQPWFPSFSNFSIYNPFH